MTHRLILLRHGESAWNHLDFFSGWIDVPLSSRGRAEARRIGELLEATGVLPDEVHTSLLRRTIETANIALDRCDRHWIPVRRDWRLNERHYGALQGQNKREVRLRSGDDAFVAWRRSFRVAPPPLDDRRSAEQARDPRYAGVTLPRSESLADVSARLAPYWAAHIVPALRAERTVMVSTHGSVIRALVKRLDEIGDAEISAVNIPTGVPLLYELDERLRPATPGRYLDPDAAARGIAEVESQGR